MVAAGGAALPALGIGEPALELATQRGRLGLAVDQDSMRAAIEQQLRDGTRTPLTLATTTIRPAKMPDSFKSIVVVNRAANTLKLFHGDAG